MSEWIFTHESAKIRAHKHMQIFRRILRNFDNKTTGLPCQPLTQRSLSIMLMSMSDASPKPSHSPLLPFSHIPFHLLHSQYIHYIPISKQKYPTYEIGKIPNRFSTHVSIWHKAIAIGVSSNLKPNARGGSEKVLFVAPTIEWVSNWAHLRRSVLLNVTCRYIAQYVLSRGQTWLVWKGTCWNNEQFSGLEITILKDYPMPQMHS